METAIARRLGCLPPTRKLSRSSCGTVGFGTACLTRRTTSISARSLWAPKTILCSALFGRRSCNLRRNESFAAGSATRCGTHGRVIGGQLGGLANMQRRDFLKAGAAGMALTLAQGSAQAQVEPRTDVKGADAKDTPEDLSVVVIGTDGNDLLDSVVDDYLAAHADVWHFMPNLAKFSQALEFIDKNPKIVLAKTTSDILAAKRGGKVAMVIGWQDSAGLTDGNGNDWRSSNPPKTKLREYYELGLRTANLTYQLSN